MKIIATFKCPSVSRKVSELDNFGVFDIENVDIEKHLNCLVWTILV